MIGKTNAAAGGMNLSDVALFVNNESPGTVTVALTAGMPSHIISPFSTATFSGANFTSGVSVGCGNYQCTISWSEADKHWLKQMGKENKRILPGGNEMIITKNYHGVL